MKVNWFPKDVFTVDLRWSHFNSLCLLTIAYTGDDCNNDDDEIVDNDDAI